MTSPLAIVGALTYVLMAERAGVEFAARAQPRVSDKVHAFTYVGFLAVAFVTMLL
jgi:hypothetical protein